MCYLKLVTDAKLLYDLDLGLVSQGLLANQSKIVPEAARRNKNYSGIMDSHQRQFEDTLSKEIQQGTNNIVVLQLRHVLSRFEHVLMQCDCEC